MGLFDKMFGGGASTATADEEQFDTLKQKYQSVLRAIEQHNVRLSNLHVENGKLIIRGTAPSADVKNRIWDQIKLADPQFKDLTADITVSESASRSQAAGAGQNYTVKAGDTLSKISRQFYGDSNEYMTIFYANRDKLSDPDKIQVGMLLVIPPKS